MKVLELFSGTESFSKVARERGHETFTVDLDRSFKPDLCKDILEFDLSMLPFKPDIIWASPPCTTFSVASIRHYWKDGKPKNEKAIHGIKIVKKTIQIIKRINPKFFIIENPRGMLRKQDFMQQLKRDTVTYCQYGLEYQKATDLWNNLNKWVPKPMCSNRSPCHVRSPRGSRKGVQGVLPARRPAFHPDWSYVIDRRGGAAAMRAVIPVELCFEIIKCCEER
ncbi:hypothetical protein LCGC14_1866200 [marine sediment metagenome]|uniref:DNA (cytosine-5-)-methyltransferase n=1 Tax=marine sediment metagenome TaxID=412755 RepID=A0A0F9J527_9ZZZZ